VPGLAWLPARPRPGALYSRAFWPILRTALASAFAGDGTGLLELANQLYGRMPNGTYSTLANAVTAIDCLDRPWPRSLACWVAPAGPFLFAGNAGSASESGYLSSSGGQLTLSGATPTDPGTVEAGATLTEIGAVTVPGAAGGEGIVAF
jgi:hypothetical protein